MMTTILSVCSFLSPASDMGHETHGRIPNTEYWIPYKNTSSWFQGKQEQSFITQQHQIIDIEDFPSKHAIYQNIYGMMSSIMLSLDKQNNYWSIFICHHGGSMTVDDGNYFQFVRNTSGLVGSCCTISA